VSYFKDFRQWFDWMFAIQLNIKKYSFYIRVYVHRFTCKRKNIPCLEGNEMQLQIAQNSHAN